MKFSGHETFSCRATWLKKGLDFIMKEDQFELSNYNQPEAATALGVGRNMVSSIRYWLNAFGLIQEKSNDIGTPDFFIDTTISSFIFKGEEDEEALDPFLEDPLTLWLLHFKLVKTNYATIYNFFFLHFIPRKSNDSFTEQEFLLSLKSYIRSSGSTVPSTKTLESDFKVLLDMYAIKTNKVNEIDDTALNILQPLEILTRQRLNKEKMIFYSLNRASLESIPIELIGMLIIELFQSLRVNSRSADLILEEIGRPFCYGREQFYELLNKLETEYSHYFTFSRARNTGINEFQQRSLITKTNFLRLKYIK